MLTNLQINEEVYWTDRQNYRHTYRQTTQQNKHKNPKPSNRGVLIERLNIIVRYGKTRPAFAKKVVFDRHTYRYHHGETMKAHSKNNCAVLTSVLT